MNRITVGRAPENNIVIDHFSVSRHHACFKIGENGGLFIVDLNSTNGVFVNGNRIIGEYAVNVQDKIFLGDHEFDWNLLVTSEAQLPGNNESNVLLPKSNHFNLNGTSSFPKRWYILAAALVFFILLAEVGFFLDKNGNSKKWTKESNEWQLRRSVIQYDMLCLRESSSVSDILALGKETKMSLIDSDITVSIEEEKKVGLELKKQLQEKYTFSISTYYTNRIDSVMRRLMRVFSNSSKYSYEHHTIVSEEINVLTAGGQLFITTAMLDYVKNDDELACVLGHEIYHNELGHISEQLKEHKSINNIFGEELGSLMSVASSLLTLSFNQENEIYSDLYGLDHAVRAGYNGCAAISLWKRMSEFESEGGVFEKLFRSHPYSNERANCIRHHIESNYYKICN